MQTLRNSVKKQVPKKTKRSGKIWEEKIYETSKELTRVLTNDFDFIYKRVAYDTLGYLRKFPERESDIWEDLSCNLFYFDSTIFDSIRNERLEKFSLITSEVKVVTGLYTCKKCKQSRVTIFQLQKSSGDEPVTTYIRCANKSCRNRWKER